MPCKHRFIEELIPDWEIKYLFIGTFNPGWSKSKGKDAKYFYGRHLNDFWYILPQIFTNQDFKESKYRNDKEFLKAYLRENKIGLTDLIKSIKDADEVNEEHKSYILGYLDEGLEKFKEIEFNDEIFNLIEKNYLSLKEGGVFLTCDVNKDSGIPRIYQKWIEIKEFCSRKQIKASELISPRRQTKGHKRKDKPKEWKDVIFSTS